MEITEKKLNFYKRHLLYVVGLDDEELQNLSSQEIYKLYLKYNNTCIYK